MKRWRALNKVVDHFSPRPPCPRFPFPVHAAPAFGDDSRILTILGVATVVAAFDLHHLQREALPWICLLHASSTQTAIDD
ncbi:hypothetical protein C8F01DRAFT_1251999 [Mycena amicta]|nr:hypothetical protein C8F01DRAFT_1251999 [Mycena amicta]